LVPFRDVRRLKVLLESGDLLSKSCKIRPHDDACACIPLSSRASGIIELDDDAEAFPEAVLRLLEQGAIRYVAAQHLPVSLPEDLRGQPVCHVDEQGSGTSERLRFAEFFAGIGGFRYGLEALGLRCVCACEIDASARRLYQLNFSVPTDSNGRQVLLHDITRLHSKDVPDHDVLTAGFPCQPFSSVSTLPRRTGLAGNAPYLSLLRIINEKQVSRLAELAELAELVAAVR